MIRTYIYASKMDYDVFVKMDYFLMFRKGVDWIIVEWLMIDFYPIVT